MADDIDIEEHDVLDHPKIQNIFPDLSLVKHEVMDKEDDFPYEDYEGFNAAVAIKVEPGTSYSVTSDLVQPNKIILGTKPSLTPVYDASQQLTLEDLGYPDTEAFVVVENMGPALARSSCYCEKCEILFATVNALDAHKMTAHSFLVAVESNNRAIKSTAKRQGPNNSLTFCNHCNTRFPDTDSLIKHMYNVMTIKCDECGLEFKNEHEKSAHQKCHLQPVITNSLAPKNLMFRCTICKCFFGKLTFFTNHMEFNHKIILNDSDLHKVPFNKKCFFCPQYFSSSRSYKHHVGKNHPKIFYKNESRNSAKTIIKSMQAVATTMKTAVNPFKCLLCNMEIKYVLYHKNKFHPKLSLSEIPIQKINREGEKQAVVFRNKITEGPTGQKYKYKYTLTQVPTSDLFKCSTCDLHFLAAYVAAQHSKSCKPLEYKTYSPQCSIPGCQKKFRECDVSLHEIQHNLRSSFNVITLNPQIHPYILNKCAKCDGLLIIMDFGAHMAECDGTASTVECEYCNLPIHSKSIRIHENRHAVKKLDLKKIKIVKYKLISEIENRVQSNKADVIEKVPIIEKVPSLKRKLSSGESEVVTKQAKGTRIELYVCDHCECVMPTNKTRKMHRERKCVEMKPIICKYCGLLLTRRSADLHYKLHYKDGLELNNFCFLNLFTSKPMPVPITKLPLCEGCEVHFGTFLSYHVHKCDVVKYQTCKYCLIDIETRYFKNHISLHEFNLKLVQKDKIVVKSEEKIAETLPELLKKYQSLQSTWNILYMCEVCEIFTDSYDVAVDHSQRHFSSLESYDITLKECKVCKVTFPLDCYKRHIELHKNTKVNRNSFNILEYDYLNLHSRKWLEMFKDFSDDQIEQILSMSLYEHSRSVKLEVATEGTKDGTLYKCARCTAAVLPENLRRHVDQANCLKPKLHQLLLQCKTCDISFPSQKMYIQHCIYHARDPKPLRVLLFNKPEDAEFNLAMRESASTQEITENIADTEPKPSHKIPEQDKPQAKKRNDNNVKRQFVFKFYRCLKCNSALTDRNIGKHNCTRFVFKCIHCGLHIYKTFYNKHVALHKTNPTFTRGNFKVTDFTKMGEKVQLHTTKFLAPVLSVSKTTATLQTKKKAYAKGKNYKINLIFKCTKCDICFLSYKSLWCHGRIGQKKPSVTCEECGLRLGTIVALHKHKEVHHSQHKLKRDDLIFECRDEFCWLRNKKKKSCQSENNDSVKPPQNNVSIKPPQNIAWKKMTLYQCYMCPILFESMRAMEYHMRKVLDVHNVVRNPCTHCGLLFSKKCIINHNAHHKKFKLTAADFVVKANPLLQCNKCALSFHMYHNFKKHVENSLCSDDGIEKQKCDVCDFVFLKTDIKKHVELFHTILNLKLDDISLVDKPDGMDKSTLTNELNKDTFKKSSNESLESKDVEILLVDESSDQQLSQVKEQKETSGNVSNMDGSDKNTIYKCYECSLHFLSSEDVKVHFASKRKYTVVPAPCSICGIKFTRESIPEHKRLHHKELKLNQKNLFIKEMYILYECKDCAMYFQHVRTLQYHIDHGHMKIPKETCTFCGYTFSTMNIKKHLKNFHTDRQVKREDFTIDVNRNDSGVIIPYVKKKVSTRDETKTDEGIIQEIQNTTKGDVTEDGQRTESGAITPNKPKPDDPDKCISETSLMDTSDVFSKDNTSVSGKSPSYANFKLKLYKCSQCNVYFLSQTICYKHVRKHEPMDPKEYIECKLCNLQFPFMSLHIHMKKHHIQRTYEPKDILIEEYFPSDEQSSPKINIYYLKEKLQSELVSTTSEIIKDVRVSTDNEKPVPVSQKVVTIKTEPPESVTVDSSDTENLDVYKDATPKVYKRSAKHSIDVRDVATPNTESALGSENKDCDIENDSLVSKIDTNNTQDKIDAAYSIADSKESEFPCDMCGERFKSRRALEFHISLDHIDEAKNCSICNESLSKSILNTIHLELINDNFKCCICKGAFKIGELDSHAQSHR